MEASAHPSPFNKLLTNALIIVLLCLTVLIVLSQANPLTTALERDSGIYAYVASQLLHGKTPYVSAWEAKTPGIIFIDAMALWWGRGTRWGIWGTEFLFLLGTAIAGFYALKKRFGFGPAILSSLLWLSGLNLALKGGNFTEEYALLFSFIWLLLFDFTVDHIEPLYISLTLGILSGAGFLLRPNNIGVQFSMILTLVVAALWEKRLMLPVKRLIAIGIGFLLPIITVTLYFILKDAFEPFLEGSLLYDLSYVGGHLDLLGSFVTGTLALGVAPVVALVGIAAVMDEFWLEARGRKLNPLLLWICLDFVIEIILSALGGRNFTHYFISWLPWIAFASGFLFSKIFTLFTNWLERFSIPLLSAGILVLCLGYSNTLTVYGQSFARLAADNPKRIQRRDLVSEYINDATLPNETVLTWGGEDGINFLARRDLPTPYFFYPLYVPSRITDRISAQYLHDVQSNPPVLIVDPSVGAAINELVPLSTPDPLQWTSSRGIYAPPYLEEFFAFFHQNYSYGTTIAGVDIYRLNR